MDKTTGLLIAFEGIDGTGKSTIAKLLKDKLVAIGYNVVIFKEPTNETEAGKKIRASYSEGRVSLEQELQWFIEDRAWNVKTRIQPALKQNKIVFLDRYFFSTACYQGARMNGDWTGILQTNRSQFPEPDLTIIFDLDPEIALDRIMKDRNESNTFEGLDYLTQVRGLFLEIYTNDEIGNYLKVDSTKSIEEISLEIFITIQHLILERLLAQNELLDAPPINND
ncbi:MAG: dTMP kinase [Candidatus Heimdallarchaeota archaeon]